MKARKPILALALALALTLTACGSAGTASSAAASASSAKSNTLVYGSNDYTRINPALDEHGEINALLFDGLTGHDKDNQVVPRLAESWELDKDTNTYTFHLRQDVTWHDGEKFTAEDVKFTYDKGAAGPLGAGLFVNYERCEIVDDYTVKIYLTSPYAGFLYGVASRLGGICCKAYYDEVGDEGYLKAPIGTGPYTLDEVINGEKIVLRANDGY